MADTASANLRAFQQEANRLYEAGILTAYRELDSWIGTIIRAKLTQEEYADILKRAVEYTEEFGYRSKS